MKKMLIPAAAGLLLASCNMNEQEMAKLTTEKDSLISVAFQKDQTINDFLGSFTEIQSDLAEITQKENALADASNNPEMIRTSRDVIKAQLQDLRTMMNDSREKIQALNEKLRKSNLKLGKFDKMVASLNEQLAAKDKDITALNTEIATLNASVETLKTSVTELTVSGEEKAREIEDKTAQLHTAYVTVGTSKELAEKQVVRKEGGLLGIGKTAKLEQNVTPDQFNRIDITQTKAIPVDNKKDVKLVTSHPTDSYTLEKDNELVTGVVITDPANFWSGSKYLVVMTN
jgi:chromosome segregation ATPase